jgi:hypothetical protein
VSVRHTLHELPPRMRGRADAIGTAVHRFLQDVSARVDREQTRNLSGSGAPGAYPVPRRTGNLARQAGHSVTRTQAVVWNAAPYARAVHEGFHAYGNPAAPYYGPRRFLSDAVATVDPIARLRAALAEAL